MNDFLPPCSLLVEGRQKAFCENVNFMLINRQSRKPPQVEPRIHKQLGGSIAHLRRRRSLSLSDAACWRSLVQTVTAAANETLDLSP